LRLARQARGRAVAARDESSGLIDSVTDAEITRAYRFIAEREGVFAEPASVAPVAGVINLAKKGFFKEGSRIVITLTGAGLKDPDFALSFEDPVTKVKSTLDAVKEVVR
jgi:threonine synthase